ncbi:uncharacterized protein N7503_009377 [Penicillium pulvis]|uniref:uncharacterized protein n=1 Tax=Penicillium pulvis TaxID=1562058 RepID=UPI00254696D4|nr:uncharacterized protein N7503_009377 [Penicillium pulvis]KAJ5793399.1 hypothetical protein N7503_009377 [Penicillium pulvis]
MISPSDTIVIADDEEVLMLKPDSSRPQRAPRRDYSYREFKSIFIELINAQADMTLSRKHRRTKAKEPSTLDDVFKGLQKAVDREV